MNTQSEQNQIQTKMNELINYRAELEVTLARLLISEQSYMAHLAELLDVCNEINILNRGY